MRRNPYYELDDRETIERLIRENPYTATSLRAGTARWSKCPPGTSSPVMAELEGDGPYASAGLAREVRLARDRR